ncbi:hypothetical protein CY35_13G114100 [Sphagnum magellanicum]|nr:hypothetical protein CY35_13G114100 [Sphagnum magellanicum]
MEVFLQQLLLDPNSPISDRWRALFTLRNLKGDGPRQALIKAMSDASNLLAHEAAFALGQMQDVAAIPALCTVLQDTSSFHPIVRHEAAEALGAIGAAECTPLLQESLVSDPAPEVQQTCELALHRIQQGQALDNTQQSPFLSVDPAVAALSSLSVADLRKVLLNENVPMYERYAALFGLRNHGDSEAVNAIVAALQAKSALLRHEVAYVLGQLQDKASTKALVSTLKDTREHPMVRHEAAEALGSIADEESVELLKEFQKDSEPIVSQSCDVALCMVDLERSGKPFELFHDFEKPLVR